MIYAFKSLGAFYFFKQAFSPHWFDMEMFHYSSTYSTFTSSILGIFV